MVKRTHSNSNHPFTVALTGGIASGKTLISDEFAKLGIPIIDTDVIAHQIVEPGQPALQEIEQVFGKEVVDENGRLKRTHLRTLIFSDPSARGKLETILHPKIRQEAGKAIMEVTAAYCILVVPLLTEKGVYPNLNRVLVVDVDTETQIKRLMVRDQCSRKDAQKILTAQATRAQRLDIADDVLDNSGSPREALEEVAQLHRSYLELSKGP